MVSRVLSLKDKKWINETNYIVAIFCVSESVCVNNSKCSTRFHKLTPEEVSQTAAYINEELKKQNLMMPFAKQSNFQRRTLVEKMIHRKQNRGHWTSNIVRSRQSIAISNLLYPSVEQPRSQGALLIGWARSLIATGAEKERKNSLLQRRNSLEQLAL